MAIHEVDGADSDEEVVLAEANEFLLRIMVEVAKETGWAME